MQTIPQKNLLSKMPFVEMVAVQKLKELAKHPYDLTKDEAFDPERLHECTSQAGEYQLFYGTERVDASTMEALFELAEETKALQHMQAMQAGEVVNFVEGQPSEQRAALHTATRDFFDHPNPSKEATQATQMAKRELDKLAAFVETINSEKKWHSILLVGIGGSELGPKAHYEALLGAITPQRTAHFLSNIDPDAIELSLRNLNLKETLVLIISKTGKTQETVTNEKILRDYFEKADCKSKEHFISITCEKSPLDNKALYREVFYIWDWVGGRYSTTSMVGGVLLSLAFGFTSFMELLKGANSMDKIAANAPAKNNLPLIAALLGIWNRNFLNHPLLAIIPYSEALKRFPSHIQQLDMESNGKHVDKHGEYVGFNTGPIIFGEPGTSSQHSFYQLIHQGTTVIPLEFITYKEPQTLHNPIVDGTSSQQKLLANVLAQCIALAKGEKSQYTNKDFQGNRPSHLLIGEKLTPFSLGALLSFYEHKVAFQGFIWQINSFDQEGVQLGKVLANKILSCFAGKEGDSPEGNTLIELLDLH